MTYTPPVISGYNTSPPPDDGSQVTANKVVWATIKTKLADPLKNYIDSINTAVASGFSGLFLSSIDDKSSTFTVGTSDDGKLFNCTSALTANLPPAVDAGEGFKVCLFNASSGTITADGNSGELINGSATSTLLKQYDAMFLICTGTGWIAIKTAGLSLQSTTIASATTTDLGTIATNNALISGTTTITGFGSSANTANPIYFIRFSGALTLTHNGTSLIIPKGMNITTVAGDSAIVEYLGSGNWRVLSYSAVTAKPPTFQYLLSGTGATYTTPAGCTAILVKMLGGGGGGGATITNNGGNGGNTIFNSINAAGGTGGTAGTTGFVAGGAGGTGGSGSAALRIAGARGGGTTSGNNAGGGPGGGTFISGTVMGGVSGTAGQAAIANTGAGGQGGGFSGSNNGGGGGGAGEYVEIYIASPATSYTYTIGAAGTAGAAGTLAGGAGGTGIIIVQEFYQ